MPTKTASLSIKALPLEVVSNNYQILSPSAFLPSTALFTLQITTVNDPNLKRTYKINVNQSNHLMQKSSLFYSLSTQYTRIALNFEESLEQSLIEEAGGLPMIFIEAPVNGLR
ncbi:22695_t:CDS:1, partial [Dentiscutata erythropus]